MTESIRARVLQFLRPQNWSFDETRYGLQMTWTQPVAENVEVARALVRQKDAIVPNNPRATWNVWFQPNTRVADVKPWISHIVHRCAFLYYNEDDEDEHDTIRDQVRSAISHGSTPENALKRVMTDNPHLVLSQLGFVPRIQFRHTEWMFEMEFVPARENQWYFIFIGIVFAVDPDSPQDCKEVLKRVMSLAMPEHEDNERLRDAFDFLQHYVEGVTTLRDVMVEINDACAMWRMSVATSAQDVLSELHMHDCETFFLHVQESNAQSVFLRVLTT